MPVCDDIIFGAEKETGSGVGRLYPWLQFAVLFIDAKGFTYLNFLISNESFQFLSFFFKLGADSIFLRKGAYGTRHICLARAGGGRRAPGGDSGPARGPVYPTKTQCLKGLQKP